MKIKVVPNRVSYFCPEQLPVFGLLHLEMNAARAFTKLNWDVFTSSLGTVLGFRSPKAQAYLHKGADHHKIWHFLEILYVTLAKELMVPYVRYCVSKEYSPTVNGYWNWSKHVKDPNYLYQSILTYACSLLMLRAGRLTKKLKCIESNTFQMSKKGSNKCPFYLNLLAVDPFLSPVCLIEAIESRMQSL